MVEPIRAATWWLRDYAYAAEWQLRAAFDRTDPAGFLDGERPPIVILPGVYETWRFLQPLAAALHSRGHPVHVVPALRRNRRPVALSAQEVADYLTERGLEEVVIVAHSKGGLIGKQVMVSPDAAGRVRGMVAVASPFGGSRYGRLFFAGPLRAFSPRDATILALARQTDANARITSVYARFDPHIPEGSELPGARNVLLDTGGHFRILADPAVIAEVIRMTDAPPRDA